MDQEYISLFVTTFANRREFLIILKMAVMDWIGIEKRFFINVARYVASAVWLVGSWLARNADFIWSEVQVAANLDGVRLLKGTKFSVRLSSYFGDRGASSANQGLACVNQSFEWIRGVTR